MKSLLSRARGVALMEVLVAVTILGVGLGAALQSLANSARLQSRASKVAAARQLAHGKLIQLEIAGALARPGLSSGAFDPPDQDYTWKLRVIPSAVSPTRRKIEVSVAINGATSALYTLDSYVLE